MRRLLAAWLPFGLLAVSSAAFGQSAFDGHVKVGVLNDQSSLYADATGQGSGQDAAEVIPEAARQRKSGRRSGAVASIKRESARRLEAAPPLEAGCSRHGA